MKLLDTTYNLYPPKKAEKIAKDMQANDLDWTYKVVHDPKITGYSFIEVYDENNKLIERL